MKKIGLYGGTFNPIHFGHLNLAIELQEKGELDEVWWIPTFCSPLRTPSLLVKPEERMEMVALAIEEIESFSLLDFEIKSAVPSYTIDTVNKILSAHPDDHFSLLLGKDTLFRFMEWKEPLALAQRIPFLIAERRRVLLPQYPDEIQQAIQQGIVETSVFEISATHVRERLNKRLYCGHLIPAKVLDFIYLNQLYFTV